jgi:hypothetical protein
MKVRWTTGSIRFRITPTELAALERGEPVTVSLPLPDGGGWTATIAPEGRGETGLCSTSERGGLCVYLTAADRDRLTDPTTEGIYFTGPLGADPVGLRYFIEKDFPCVHPRPKEAPEDSETFAPPPGFTERHKTTCL